jgi:hypothetical protein
MPQGFLRTAGIGLVTAVALITSSCATTPSKLEKWANTQGSEDLYKDVLINPESDLELRQTALFLLVRQWDYSAPMLRGGGLIKDMPEAVRNETVKAILPRVKSELMGPEGAARIKARDALWSVRAGLTDASTIAEIDAIVFDWVQNSWKPCAEVGSVSFRDILNGLGPEKVTPILVNVVKAGKFEDVACMQQQIRNTSWLPKAEPLAAALIGFWDAGKVSADPQLRYSFLEDLVSLTDAPSLRPWLFKNSTDPAIPGQEKNLMLDAIQKGPASATDIANYKQMLTSNTLSRWSAVESLVNMKGSEGLGIALSSLPADGLYGYWNGGQAPDGFKKVVSEAVCNITKLTDLGDNARMTFEQHIGSPIPAARAIAIRCLQKFGDATSIPKLEAQRAQLGRAPVEIPAWGGMSFQALIDETIAEIRKPKAPAAPAAAPK